MEPPAPTLSPASPADTESYRAANLLINQFGMEAPTHAAQWAAEMKLDGDDEAAEFWARVLRALTLLLSSEIPQNLTRH